MKNKHLNEWMAPVLALALLALAIIKTIEKFSALLQ
jgi:hypothetical protein